MDMWIQLHDFSAEERNGIRNDQAIEALTSFNWSSELAKQNQSNEETCDPGLGLISENGAILHICPKNKEHCCIHYHYSIPKRILGFIPSVRQKSHFIETCTIRTAIELINHHFAGNKEQILDVK